MVGAIFKWPKTAVATALSTALQPGLKGQLQLKSGGKVELGAGGARAMALPQTLLQKATQCTNETEKNIGDMYMVLVCC